MRRLLVNDCLSAMPGHRTFWNDLKDWFGMEFVGSPYERLAEHADSPVTRPGGPAELPPSLIVRNASYFGPLKASETIPTISLLQDIFEAGPAREAQERVILGSSRVVANSRFTASHYKQVDGTEKGTVIPLPIDFSLFEPQNAMGCQQALSLPDGCICWIGACQGAAGHIKGWDVLIQIARLNPDLKFVAVLKDALPDSFPPNMRCYVRLTHEELVKVIGACRIGLCTSRIESQHLAGIEMGACGLPMAAPEVGVYWRRRGIPGIILVQNPTPDSYSSSLRWLVPTVGNNRTVGIREYWRKEFDREVIREKWSKLIEEVEDGAR